MHTHTCINFAAHVVCGIGMHTHVHAIQTCNTMYTQACVWAGKWGMCVDTHTHTHTHTHTGCYKFVEVQVSGIAGAVRGMLSSRFVATDDPSM